MAEISRLPGPIADLWEWQYDGACRAVDPSVFFHPEGERGPARRRRDESAKAVCATCPVRERCLEFALEARPGDGVWGGLTAQERHRLIRRRQKAARKAREAA